MSTATKIERTRGDDGAAGATWDPVTGCSEVSEGCDHCYAKAFVERWRGIPGHPFEQGFDIRLWPDRLGLPLRWRKPKRVFLNSMSDLWHDAVPDEFIEAVWTTMFWTSAEGRPGWRKPRHTYQILTKRPDRMRIGGLVQEPGLVVAGGHPAERAGDCSVRLVHGNSFLAQVWAVMALTPQHTYQVLTKRPRALPARPGRLWRCGGGHAPGVDVRRLVSDHARRLRQLGARRRSPDRGAFSPARALAHQHHPGRVRPHNERQDRDAANLAA
jgi:protein gp37